MFEKYSAGRALPTGIGVRKEMADVFLADGAEDGIRDGVHEGIGIRMAIEALGVGDFNAAEDEFASGDELVDVITDADVSHRGKANGNRCGKPEVRSWPNDQIRAANDKIREPRQ